MTGVVYGIDFGTSNSALAIGMPRAGNRYVGDVAGAAGANYQIPTAVCALDDGTLVVGRQAVNRKQSSPGSYLDNFKRYVGHSSPIILGGQRRRVEELVTATLGFLHQRAKAITNSEPEVVVITVPASWNRDKKEVIRTAAINAGMGAATIELMAEPAAAGAYALSQNMVGQGQGRLLVYDLGGGTFDCAVAERRDKGELQVLDYGGCDIGGTLFDEVVQTELRARHPEQTAELFSEQAKTSSDLLRLLQVRAACERLKCQLSNSEQAFEMLTELRPPVEFELTRARFEQLVAPSIDETIRECTALLERLGMSWAGVSAVLPVGGSSVIPLVRQRLQQSWGRAPRSVYDSHLATVNGAVLRARALAGVPDQSAAVAPTIVDMAPTQGGTRTGAESPRWDPTNVDSRRNPAYEYAIEPTVPKLTSKPAGRFWAPFLIWAVASVALATQYWNLYWAAGSVALVAAALRVMLVSRRPEPWPSATEAFAATTAVLSGLMMVGGAALYVKRAVMNGFGANWLPAVLGIVALASGLTLLVMLTDADLDKWTANRKRTEIEDKLKRLRDARKRVGEERLFGMIKAQVPPMLEPLLRLPAVRVVKLARDPIFTYAITAGPRVVLVHLARSANSLPEMDASLNGWRAACQNAVAEMSGTRTVKARAVIVVPGDSAPQWSFDAAALITTESDLPGVVGPFLAAEPYRVLVPMVAATLG
ncbi:Hsp70 family protein [Catellatospora tritici]|uniref:Hsp70 family protein n=1 Tax=Catellatospora tritici TaxID=2851566 RepID=UPI001C2D8613|nr:Hsp70 family protein [Catellatospora tritici]MBV1852689.1 Hsp70 family protein [Catellatospora tritici]